MTSYAVQVQRLDSVPLAVVRRQASASELARVVPECCGLVWKAMRAQQAQAGRHVAIYWDGSIRLEVGVELHGPFAEAGEIVHSATPAGAVASATHFGPYGGLGAAHDAVRQWCSANNRRLAGPNWEIYGHWQREWDADPSRIRTDVYYLLSDGSGLQLLGLQNVARDTRAGSKLTRAAAATLAQGYGDPPQVQRRLF